jgi:hypothetical protein
MENFNKLFFHPLFNDTIAEINRLNVQLPANPSDMEMDFHLDTYPQNGGLVSKVEDIKSYKLNDKNGEKFAQSEIILCAYDESINNYLGLEGIAYLTSHSLIVHYKEEYLPLNFLTFYFYTRAEIYSKESNVIKYSTNIEVDSKKDYVNDRNKFIINNTPNNSILFIDGPLFGGNLNAQAFQLNEKLLEKNIIPLFFVKNSYSSLATDHIEELKGKYNSDLHWAYNSLGIGERTNLFKYTDEYNKKDYSKVFFYIKIFNISPQRVEFHTRTYEKYWAKMPELFDLIYYLLLVQGDLKNPQIRSISIAEKYARATLKLINVNQVMKKSGIVPTMNQERFGW